MRAIGDVRDDFAKIGGVWYERHKIGRVVLNGSETWSNTSGTGTDNWFYRINAEYSGITDRKGETGSSDNSKSNLYPNGSIGVSNTDQGFQITNGNQIRIRWGTEDTLENFETWLSTHNLEIIYLLAEPTLTECTTEQVEQLEAITTDRLYEGGTSFYSEDVVPPYLEVQYYTAESEE